MSDHFYTTSVSEHDSVATGAYDSEGVAGFVFTGPEPGPVPLYRAYNPYNGDHFYTANGDEYNNAVNNYGYIAEGITGFLHDPNKPPVEGTKPFFRLWMPRSGDHFYTTIEAERDNAVTNIGYHYEGIVGYVWDPTNGGEPLYRSFNPNNGDHFYTMNAVEHANATNNLGFIDEGIACRLQPTSATKRVPFFRCFNTGNGDHFYTINHSELSNAVNYLGYVNEGIACYVHSDSSGGGTPFYRLYHPVTGDHFYTTSEAERDNAVANIGYVYEGEACYIFAGPTAETTGLFRLFKYYDALVYVNLIAVSGDSWTNVQWNMLVNGFAGAAQILKQVGIRLREADRFYVPTAAAGGYPTIDSNGEAEDLTEDWTVQNFAIDLFCVPVYVGSVAGLSPVNGSCDKDTKGMNGVVVERVDPLNVIIAHELGHYMGLEHLNIASNFMNEIAVGANTVATAEQGAKMKEHCFILKY